MSVFKEVSTNDNNILLSNIFTSLYTHGIWANGVGTLTTFHTSSAQSDTSKLYYTQVWMSASANVEENEMFSIAYGHINGYGSKWVDGDINVPGLQDTPSRGIYSQYLLTCLDEYTYDQFYLGSADNSHLAEFGYVTAPTGSFGVGAINHFYAISLDRRKYGDRLDAGNFQLNLAELNGNAYPNNYYTGSNVEVSSSNKIISLIDDSMDYMDSTETTQRPSKMRNLVSGTLGNIHSNTSGGLDYYGLVFPEHGVILIDANKLNLSASFNTVSGSGSIDGQNPQKLFTSISGAAEINADYGFIARGVEIKNQQTIFVRVNSDEMNYSNNPTMKWDDDGKLLFDSFKYDPYSYITTVGLYNDNNDLLAVAKLSKPIQKSFNSEVSITVKLEY